MNSRSSSRFAIMLAAIALAASQPAAANLAAAGDHLPVMLVSASPAFDDACSAYYNAGNDSEVMTDYGIPEIYCQCLAERYTNQGLGADALDFFARTYSDDLTTFIDEYPEGEAWMRISADAEVMCKSG